MKLSEHIKIYIRSLKLMLELSREYFVLLILQNVISAIIPFVPIYFSAKLIDSLIESAPIETLVLYVVLTVGLVFLLNVLNTFIIARHNIASGKMYQSYNWKFSEKAMEFAYEELEKRDITLLRDRIQAERQYGYNIFFLYSATRSLITNAVRILTSFALCTSFFLTKSIPLYLKLILIFSVILIVVVGILIQNRNEKLQRNYMDEEIELNILYEKLIDYMNNYSSGKDIRLYDMADNLEKYEIDTIFASLDKYHYFNKKRFFSGGINKILNAALGLFLYLLLIYAALDGGISVGSIAKYVSSLTIMLGALSGIVGAVQRTITNSEYMKRFFSYFDIKNNMYKGSLTVEKRDDNEYFVEFKNVSFKYPQSETWALKNVNIKFKVGEKLAVVGMNGSGKTTFIKLMCRLYDPTEGEILLNGVNIKKYDYDEYLSLFSVVFQDFRLFAFTLGQNVAASAVYDREKAERALIMAGFGERLSTMKKGCDTYLHKNCDDEGVEISGGEGQKIALARALYKDAPFIVLDEPTAALDPVSEYEVYSKFSEIAGEKTAIYISHRLASCRFCDKIAVFDNGSIVQIGSHEALLLDNRGKYSELWNAQAQYYVDNKIKDNI